MTRCFLCDVAHKNPNIVEEIMGEERVLCKGCYMVLDIFKWGLNYLLHEN